MDIQIQVKADASEKERNDVLRTVAEVVGVHLDEPFEHGDFHQLDEKNNNWWVWFTGDNLTVSCRVDDDGIPVAELAVWLAWRLGTGR